MRKFSSLFKSILWERGEKPNKKKKDKRKLAFGSSIILVRSISLGLRYVSHKKR
jgi:hypothetical protein